MAYSQKVVDRFESVLKNPEKHSVGRFNPNDPNVATGMVGAPACGDVMKLQLKLDENGIIIDVKFKTYGCGSAIASSTMFVEMLTGKTIEEAKQIKDKEIAEALQLPPIKLHCSVLAESGIKNSDDIKKFNSTGIYNFLIGESLLKSKDKEKKIGELLLNESY